MCDAQQKQLIADSIRGIPDFPKKGILFWDVTTLMLDSKVFQATIDAFVERYADQQIDAVAGAHGWRVLVGHSLSATVVTTLFCSATTA